MTIITRFAPSPTGTLHIGSARTALFNYLFAKKHGGKFVLRIEDTDRERSKKEFEAGILESLAWLGLTYDDMYRQSERTPIYTKYLKELVKKDLAYVSKEEGVGEGKSAEVIRFRNPNKNVTFKDLILGEISFDTTELKDFIIAKDFQTPLYNLAVVIDDYEMGITHVIRGQDHISNTPRQILMIEALGLLIPSYAHIPLILAPDRSKLSKRHGALSTLEYRQMGYLSEAIINFLALLGWHPKDDRELFSLNDLIKEFELERVQKGGAVFDITKLDWLNREYIKILPHDLLFSKIKEELLDVPNSQAERLLPIILERINKWGDIITIKEELKFFWQFPDYDPQKLIWKEGTKEKTLEALMKVKENLAALDSFDEKSIKNSIWLFAETKGKGAVLWPMRYALSGRDKSPDPILIASVLGQKETLQRLQIAIEALTR
ncbi:MAG TPA: glutamate--tRNA ligase [Candidatus Paceibacterota bacterium]|nr:glutamate--tRNA ligase [Candidatus Paceibacterota bacterium]